VTRRRKPAGGASASLRKDASGEPPFRRVLVANRGEIAVRVIRACRELGMESVAVYSDADAGSAHVRLADVAVRLGPAPARESYLLGAAIVRAALETGAEAIHPGYGFLAERAQFARAVEDAGLVFVGPSSAAIAALGDKLAARRLALAADVPVVPGTLEPAVVDRADALDAVLGEADAIGFPLLVKATAGGGGRGMRRVARREDLPAALTAGAAESLAAFGDGSVYLEREIRPARHIEVQLVGDAAGTIVALGERDCSIQRRHQKLIEESPAPGLTDDERASLHELAVRVARAAGLRGVATAEFLFDENRRAWFLEVNARLQVEHGVTELVTGLDLVAEQFRVAAGAPLSPDVLAAAARAGRPERHAIEVRLSAEDPARDFAPAPGRIGRWAMPAGPGVRVDTAVEAGERVPPDYDPLIAKVLVVAGDRGAAIDRLRRALDEVAVGGIQTTLPFHRFVARHAGFIGGDLSIDWVAENWDGEADRKRALGSALAAAGLAVRNAVLDPPPVPARGGRGPDQASAWLREGRELGVDRWPR
jgi:acetyl/propionyl-CoA carboxylase alpha subunit